MAKREVLLPWLPDYFTIAIYPQGMDFVAHELRSDLWVRDMIALTALRKLSDRLIEVQLATEKAQRQNYVVRHNHEGREASPKLLADIKKKKGVILRNVVIEP